MQVADGADIKSAQSTTDNPQVKSLEDWKASLANIKLVNSTSPAGAFPKISELPQLPMKSPSPAKFGTVEPAKTDGLLLPPSIPLDVSKFLNSISKLKLQFA
jgi:hypothetical protein